MERTVFERLDDGFVKLGYPPDNEDKREKTNSRNSANEGTVSYCANKDLFRMGHVCIAHNHNYSDEERKKVIDYLKSIAQ